MTMRILVGNYYLQKTGGSENYTYALATTLKKMGHEVEYFGFVLGEVSKKLESEGITFMHNKQYDLILANHVPVVERLFLHGFTIQTCHGALVELEQPSPYADAYVSVTEEVHNHLKELGFDSDIMLNGIDCERFSPKRPLQKELTNVLSLCQSDESNTFLRECCESIGVNFSSCNKHTDNVWAIEEEINKADLVIGIGRSLYDAMACGRCVLSFDNRDYVNQALGDGYINKDNISESIKNNCSGRRFRKQFTKESLVEELRKYNPNDGQWAREYALEHLNMKKSAERYISLYKKRSKDDLTQLYGNKLPSLRNIIDSNTKVFHLENEQNIAIIQRIQQECAIISNQITDINNSVQNNTSNVNNLYCTISRLENELKKSNNKRNKYLRTIRLIIYILSILIIVILTLHIFMFQSL